MAWQQALPHRRIGFAQQGGKTVKQQQNEARLPVREENAPDFPLAAQYLRFLQTAGVDVSAILAAGEGLAMQDEALAGCPCPEEQERPFLSVVVCTQGACPARLREVLLCLAAQTCQRFEVLLVGWNVPPQQQETLAQIQRELVPPMREKTRYLSMEDGAYAAVLNRAFAEAAGQYIAILPEGDLVLAHWAESVLAGAQAMPGAVVHSYAVAQRWCWGPQPDALCAVDAPQNTWCAPFDARRQAVQNACPAASLAFPRALFHRAGLRFDEGLQFAPVWDFLMCAANIAGVVDVPEITSIRRCWQQTDGAGDTPVGAETCEIYEGDGCDAAEEGRQREEEFARVRRRIAERPQLLAPGMGAPPLPRSEEPVPGAALYLDTGGGFADTQLLCVPSEAQMPRFHYIYTLPAGVGPVQRFRFDPAEYGELLLRELEIVLVLQDGQRHRIPHSAVGGNARLLDGVFYCMQYLDPQLHFEVPAGMQVQAVEISGHMVPPGHEDKLAFWSAVQQEGAPASFWQRVKDKLR